jgi:FADH2 O2-dependent halogenase
MYDVVILGSGFSGSMLGTILARHGHKVLLVDAGKHPRFAIGESTILQTSQVISLLARTYNVPELEQIGLNSPEGLRDVTGTTSGIKRLFGFVYHNHGEAHDPTEALLFGNRWRDENHLYRPDIDQWLFELAKKYGCTALEETRVDSVDFDDNGVTVHAGGESYRARYVFDGTGYRSVLADSLGLRHEEPSQKMVSCAMFTHMKGVRRFEDVVESGMSKPWWEGTLHHLFDGGWIYVIPFNNWTGGTNDVVSVGLSWDPRKHDPKDFQSFLAEHLPSVAEQFADAEPVRPWVRTGRIQYSSRQSVGRRWALAAHASSFVDAMFSRGLITTVEVLRTLLPPLLAALEDDNFDPERFSAVQKAQERLLSYSDRLVWSTYRSWRDFDLWNAWFRVWIISTLLIETNLGSVLLLGPYSRHKSIQDPIFSEFEDAGFKDFFNACVAVMERVDRGELTDKEGAAALHAEIDAYDFTIPLPDHVKGQEWAVRNPQVHDMFFGDESQHAQWVAAIAAEQSVRPSA